MDLLRRFLEKDPTKRISIDEILVILNDMTNFRLIHGSNHIPLIQILLPPLVSHEMPSPIKRFVTLCLFELALDISS